MTTVNDSKFKNYLEAISEKYKCWWNLYTFTDAEGKKKQEQKSSSLPSPFDFGLMVETLQPKQEQGKQEEEKTERLPVLKGIRKYANNHVLLVGKPGSGKSTALARLLFEEAQAHLEINFQAHSQSRLKTTKLSAASEFQLTSAISQEIDSVASSVNNTTIPVLVELRYWQSSIFERIEAFLQQHDANLNLDETTLKNQLRQGKFLLLIDGVNELPSEDARRQVAIFRQDYPQTPMIFTTRDLSVGGDLGIEKKLEMQPLNDLQMREFVMAYLPQQGEELLQRLKDRLREFGKTPLLLWMLCELFKQTKNIPPNLGMVFRLFTQSYENNWRGDVAVTAESRRWWKSLLEYLAFKMMQGKAVTEFLVAIPKGEVEEIFTQYLDAEKLDKPRDNAKCWLEDLLKHHLIQVGSGDKIEFRHQLLQEYYAAEYLLSKLSQISDDKLKRNYLNLLKWTESVALMLALVEDKKQALRVVKFGLNIDLMLGARLAGEIKPEFQQQPIDWILEKKLPSLLEIQLLEITGSHCAVNALINALNHQYYSVRRNAADALGKIDSERAVDRLINALNHQDSDVRRGAAEVLGKIGSQRAVDALIKALNHQDSDVSSRAEDALGKIGSETAVDALINALNHEDSDVPWRAADAFANIIGLDNITQLWKLLLNGTNEAKYIILNIQERCKFYNHDYFPPVEDDESTDQTTQAQKILILAAIPHGLRLDKEIRSIEECIRRAVRRDKFKVEIKTAVQSQDIRRAIAEEKPQIVHFCGHGLEDGSLLLEDDGGNEKPVGASGLAALFKLHADYVKCVVLNACHSIKTAEAISQYINITIGMNQPIQDKSAVKFAQGFYDGLGYETSDKQDMFQRAFQEGLVAIKLDNFSQGEIPVIKTKLNFLKM